MTFHKTCSNCAIQIKPITYVIAFVESKEKARNANPTPAVSSLSARNTVDLPVTPLIRDCDLYLTPDHLLDLTSH